MPCTGVIAANAALPAVENEIPSISGLATNTALRAVENKIPNISSLVKKNGLQHKNYLHWKKKLTDRNHDKYITTPEFNNLAAGAFTWSLAQSNIMTKTDFYNKLRSPKKLTQIKQSTYSLKMNWKSWKHLIQAIL